MDTDQLRAALRGATPDIEPRPGLTADVLRGGIRRTRVRRLTLTAAAFAAAALVTTTVTVGWQSLSKPVDPATKTLLRGPTRGDLAGDSAFAKDVLDVWEHKPKKPAAKVVTRPHVFWAGTTPAGRVAVVAQGTDKGDTVRGLVGLDVQEQTLRLLILDEPETRARAPMRGLDMGYRFGPDNRYVLALSKDKPLFVVFPPFHQGHQMPMREAGGVGLGEVPPGVGPTDDIRVLRGSPYTDGTPSELLHLYPDATPDRPGVRWDAPDDRPYTTVAQPWAAPLAHWDDIEWLNSHWRRGLAGKSLRYPPGPGLETRTNWFISVREGGPIKYVIGEYHDARTTPTYLYAVEILPDGSTGGTRQLGTADLNSPLPILVPLPDNGGFLAAAPGANLAYRTAKGSSWSMYLKEAVRVPSDAVEISVSFSGKDPVTVPIKR
ncbi:hypothetical protein [Kibdelosporangium phytohabitans]|uniref:Uncharacterized protein n=1 Tax=Kibdelosporangium phytohabitans TaxID=860235 RepID=A0A0N9IDC1_9PSEU|nr:hypothetical protein [Kibdelosporangium phytohabitans]ALG13299.1 hypothetical protein AOZ06_46310 [Kibdelosporangium phytohabitans]MBE1465075.1 hypothetical protein [Kibdelosporangium phytohabitans]